MNLDAAAHLKRIQPGRPKDNASDNAAAGSNLLCSGRQRLTSLEMAG